MSMEPFNACVYLADRQVQAGLGGHLAVTGPAGSLTYAGLMRPVYKPGKIAAWLAPPRSGINGQPLDYEYVRF
jgi:hypothetical protein